MHCSDAHSGPRSRRGHHRSPPAGRRAARHDMSGHPSALDQLKEAAGPNGFTEDPQEIAPHLIEWRGRYRGQSPLMLKPDATAAVSRILAICNETRTPIVPQGGNTGLRSEDHTSEL